MTGPARELSRRAAIVGLGDTDYGVDYRAARTGDLTRIERDPVALAKIALDRALADAGLQPSDIDGVSLCLMHGDSTVVETCRGLGVSPHYVQRGRLMDNVIPPAVEALVRGECDTIALVYSALSRSLRMVYGGTSVGPGAPVSYYYFHPWGWSSQAAHAALACQFYQATYGYTEEDLSSVALTLRRHAGRNDRAIMRGSLSLDSYMRARYIVRPLRLYDICLVNDGAVCLILRREDMAADLAKPPVAVAGWGRVPVKFDQLRSIVTEPLRPHVPQAGREAFEMAGLGPADVGHFQGYDFASIQLVNFIEALGFVEAGAGLAFCRDGQLDVGGRLPTNTNGGLLSEAYMHGWNLVAESVRQLRHEAGARQVADVGASLYAIATTEFAHTLLLTRSGG